MDTQSIYAKIQCPEEMRLHKNNIYCGSQVENSETVNLCLFNRTYFMTIARAQAILIPIL